MPSCRKAGAALGLALALMPTAFAADGMMHTGAPSPAPGLSGAVPHTNAMDGIIHTEGISWREAPDAFIAPRLGLVGGLLTRL